MFLFMCYMENYLQYKQTVKLVILQVCKVCKVCTDTCVPLLRPVCPHPEKIVTGVTAKWSTS